MSRSTLPEDLQSAADRAIARRDPRVALLLLAQAEAAGARTAALHMSRALALRMTGEFAAAVGALDQALDVDPYAFLAHLSKGALLERLERPRAAARSYRIALDLAPPADRLPASVAAAAERARACVQEQAEALAARLRADTAALRGSGASADLARFDWALTVYSGLAPPPPTSPNVVQQPLLLHYPDLPTAPFLPREYAPWLAELEAATPAVQADLERVLALRPEGWAPYIAYPPGAPVNQWGELNHSRRWSTLFFWKDGERQPAVCDACPDTAALLDRMPMARQTDFAPTAMFSALEPRTRIPPHTGSANFRLIVHLPLVLPGPARFRVGDETREWRIGEAWVFDDTIEHEAWNDADETRVILIFDIWHPALSDRERALIGAMMQAKNTWTAEEG